MFMCYVIVTICFMFCVIKRPRKLRVVQVTALNCATLAKNTGGRSTLVLNF